MCFDTRIMRYVILVLISIGNPLIGSQKQLEKSDFLIVLCEQVQNLEIKFSILFVFIRVQSLQKWMAQWDPIMHTKDILQD